MNEPFHFTDAETEAQKATEPSLGPNLCPCLGLCRPIWSTTSKNPLRIQGQESSQGSCPSLREVRQSNAKSHPPHPAPIPPPAHQSPCCPRWAGAQAQVAGNWLHVPRVGEEVTRAICGNVASGRKGEGEGGGNSAAPKRPLTCIFSTALATSEPVFFLLGKGSEARGFLSRHPHETTPLKNSIFSPSLTA